MLEFSTRDSGPQDALFYERLEAFMNKCLVDIKAFADRESRPFEEVFQALPFTGSFASDVSFADSAICSGMALKVVI